MPAIGGHHKPHRGETDTWLTPPDVVGAVGPFDLDPCCPAVMPWPTATRMVHHPAEDGLAIQWKGRVWLNPPYGPDAEVWLKKLADHGDGVALLMARTETRWFFSQVWERADALLFFKGRLHFHRPDGKRAKANAGAGSVLVAYGRDNAVRLRLADLDGQFIALRN